MTDRYRVRQTDIEAAVCFCQMLHPVPNFICNASVEVVNSLLRNVVLCPMEFFFLQCRFTLRNRHLKGDTLRRHYGRLSRKYWYTVRMKIIRVFQLSVHAKHTTLWLAAVRCFKLLVQVFIWNTRLGMSDTFTGLKPLSPTCLCPPATMPITSQPNNWPIRTACLVPLPHLFQW